MEKKETITIYESVPDTAMPRATINNCYKITEITMYKSTEEIKEDESNNS